MVSDDRYDVSDLPEAQFEPGSRRRVLKTLTGNLAGRYAVSVSGNWRLTFGFDGEDVVLIDYQDYH